ncbi:CDG_1a_G0013590.mRNA.1.CDS.1 [Saccharomyces cerevisiae]|nr:CDG_1a_G0013590.mRNA.1.CDS.1 [Saccharomyces cerevisiae]CAI7231011.1 CDG_1a_G0013590.mRNA.1.CDS.1 [Saccharomyces cerevisiae]
MKLSSAFILSAITVAALGESIATTITATKNGHVYTKTVTQDATFVWAGEGAAVTSAVTEASTVAATSAAAETSVAAETSIVEPSTSAQGTSADEGSGSIVASTTTSSESSATIVTPTRIGQAYTESSFRDAQSVRTHESNNWSSSSSASTKMVSSITRVQTTTAGIFTNGKSSTTPQIVNYTGAADSIAAGTGLMGAALAAVIFL